jgi:hypothetical protein
MYSQRALSLYFIIVGFVASIITIVLGLPASTIPRDDHDLQVKLPYVSLCHLDPFLVAVFPLILERPGRASNQIFVKGRYTSAKRFNLH